MGCGELNGTKQEVRLEKNVQNPAEISNWVWAEMHEPLQIGVHYQKIKVLTLNDQISALQSCVTNTAHTANRQYTNLKTPILRQGSQQPFSKRNEP